MDDERDGKACCDKKSCCGGKALAAIALLAIGAAGGYLSGRSCGLKEQAPAAATQNPAK